MVAAQGCVVEWSANRQMSVIYGDGRGVCIVCVCVSSAKANVSEIGRKIGQFRWATTLWLGSGLDEHNVYTKAMLRLTRAVVADRDRSWWLQEASS